MNLTALHPSKTVRFSYLLVLLCWLSAPLHLILRIRSDMHELMLWGCGGVLVFAFITALCVRPRDFIPALCAFLGLVLHGALTPVA